MIEGKSYSYGEPTKKVERQVECLNESMPKKILKACLYFDIYFTKKKILTEGLTIIRNSAKRHYCIHFQRTIELYNKKL